jgi:hypothetical protein
MEYRILDVAVHPLNGGLVISAQALDANGTFFTAFVEKALVKTSASANEAAIVAALNKRYAEITAPTARPKTRAEFKPLINAVVGGTGKKGKGK